jgi:hypothetical protein
VKASLLAAEAERSRLGKSHLRRLDEGADCPSKAQAKVQKSGNRNMGNLKGKLA